MSKSVDDMAKIDFEKIRKQVVRSKGFHDVAKKEALVIFNEAKVELLNRFDNHPVTIELERGVNGVDNTGLLQGAHGDLFSFIGFDSTDRPIDALRDDIKSIRFIDKPIVTDSGVAFTNNALSLDDILYRHKMPWESGRSWLVGIEQGIRGLSYYVSRLFAGRSEGGTQAKSKLRNATFKRTSYFTKMYNRFLRKAGGE
jgi:hypothetical protein